MYSGIQIMGITDEFCSSPETKYFFKSVNSDYIELSVNEQSNEFGYISELKGKRVVHGKQIGQPVTSEVAG